MLEPEGRVSWPLRALLLSVARVAGPVPTDVAAPVIAARVECGRTVSHPGARIPDGVHCNGPIDSLARTELRFRRARACRARDRRAKRDYRCGRQAESKGRCHETTPDERE